MAISITTVPTDYSSRGVFVASTGVAEDSTHVNVRVEAQLISGSTILAKKTNPKALTTFDFTDILRSFINFTNPTPFTNPAAADIVAPTKTGSNLLTSWANKTSFLWTNFTSSGANISVCNGTPGATNMMCESNAISFVDGTVYVLLWKSKTLTGSQFPFIEIGSNGSTPLGTYSNFCQQEIEDYAANRMYFLCKSTGSYKLTIGAKAGAGAVSLAGNFELYAMSTHDWYKQYSIKFVEKWEDASGATQTGATGDNFKLYTFFKSSATETIFNSTYIEAVGADGVAKFLNVNGYFQNTQRSVELIKTPLTGNKSTANLMYVAAPSIYNLDIVNVTFTAEDIYSPIICIVIPYSTLTTTTAIALFDPFYFVSENYVIVLNSKCYPYHKELQWINELGGISTFFFGDEFKQKRLPQKDTYQDANKIKRLYNATPIIEITVASHFLTRQETAEYLADIVDSELVMETTTIYKQVFVQDEEIPVRDKGNLMTAEVTYQYGS